MRHIFSWTRAVRMLTALGALAEGAHAFYQPPQDSTIGNTARCASLAQEMATIRAKGRLVVAISQEQVPLFHEKNPDGTWHGLDIRAARVVAKALQVPLVLLDTAQNANQVIKQVESGQADLGISMLSFSGSRSQKVLFAPTPYMKLRKCALINRLHLANAGNVSLHTLIKEYGTHIPIGIHQGTSYESFTKHHAPNAKYLYYTKWADVEQALIKGDILLALVDNMRMEQRIFSDFNFHLRVMPVLLPYYDNIYAIAHPQYPHLIQWIALLLMNNNSVTTTYEELKNMYGAKRTSTNH